MFMDIDKAGNDYILPSGIELKLQSLRVENNLQPLGVKNIFQEDFHSLTPTAYTLSLYVERLVEILYAYLCLILRPAFVAPLAYFC